MSLAQRGMSRFGADEPPLVVGPKSFRRSYPQTVAQRAARFQRARPEVIRWPPGGQIDNLPHEDRDATSQRFRSHEDEPRFLVGGR